MTGGTRVGSNPLVSHPVQQLQQSEQPTPSPHKAGWRGGGDRALMGRSSHWPIPSGRGPCECTRVANLSASSDQDPYGNPLPGWHVEVQDGPLGRLVAYLHACCPPALLLLMEGGFTVATNFLGVRACVYHSSTSRAIHPVSLQYFSLRTNQPSVLFS
jgi:hypothetical protein